MRFRPALLLSALLVLPPLAAAADPLRNGDHTDGVAIIAAQPRELTIVNIVGSISLAKLAQLQGKFGVPRVGITVNGQAKNGATGSQTH